MTRNNSSYLLHRASERVSAGAAAIALTFAMLLTVDARATETAGAAPSITISYSDVNFLTNEGAAKVHRALKNAARRVCGIGNGAELLSIRVARQECYEATLSDAVQKIDRPTLTAVHTNYVRNLG
jgi:UrcA family protein